MKFDFGNVLITLTIGFITIWYIESFSNIKLNKLFKITTYIITLLGMSVYVAFKMQQIIALPQILESHFSLFVKDNLRLQFYIAGVMIMLTTMIICRKTLYASGFNSFCVSCSILFLGCLIADFIKCDYEYNGIIFITLIYLGKKLNTNKGFIIGNITLIPSMLIQIGCLLSIPLIKLYNGNRGKNIKYFFYWFYPIHLTIICVIFRFLGLNINF